MAAVKNRHLNPMKTRRAILSTLAASVLVTLPVSADTYGDATGDFTGGAWGDITSVVVNNDATTLTFKINTAGDPDLVVNTWHHYYIGISTSLNSPGGNLNTTPYNRNIQMSVGGMDFALLSYPAFNGYDRFVTAGNGPAMTFSGTGTTSWDSTGVTITAQLSDLGLSPGNTIGFDVWTSDSGTDTVLDALSDTVVRGFNNSPFDTGAGVLSYTVVPEPTTAAFVGLGVLALICRSKRRNVS
jgi:hypothetical protein